MGNTNNMTRPDKLYGLEIPYDKTVDELIEITKEKAPNCWTAYTALAYHNSTKSINILEKLLSNQDWTHTRSAIEAIGLNKKGSQLEDKLISYLNHSNKFIVTAAIKSLSNLGCKKAHDKIKSLVNYENLEIQQAAIEGLSHIWESSDFDFLIGTYRKTENQNTRKSIGFVLAEHINDRNWKLLYDAFHNDKITRHREWALSVAKDCSGDKTLIEPFLNDADGHIRKNAKHFIDN